MTERTNKLKEQFARVGRTEVREPATPPITAGPASGDTPAPEPDAHRTERRDRARTAGRRKPAAGESWDDRVKRATFYVDRALIDELDACCDRHDLNKSEFVREAIIRHLQTYR